VQDQNSRRDQSSQVASTGSTSGSTTASTTGTTSGSTSSDTLGASSSNQTGATGSSQTSSTIASDSARDTSAAGTTSATGSVSGSTSTTGSTGATGSVATTDTTKSTSDQNTTSTTAGVSTDTTNRATADIAAATSGAAAGAADVTTRITEWRLAPAEIQADVDRSVTIVRTKDNVVGAPTGATEDSVIETMVKGKLQADPQVSTAMIDVEAKNGEVSLKGSAKDASQIGRAIALALDTQGVTKVSSDIKVSANK
jgi:osmotically-inducible protein OsmY